MYPDLPIVAINKGSDPRKVYQREKTGGEMYLTLGKYTYA